MAEFVSFAPITPEPAMLSKAAPYYATVSEQILRNGKFTGAYEVTLASNPKRVAVVREAIGRVFSPTRRVRVVSLEVGS